MNLETDVQLKPKGQKTEVALLFLSYFQSPSIASQLMLNKS